MNLSQNKLSRSEWNSIEISVSNDEKDIIKMIIDGYNNIDISFNNTKNIMNYLKIEYSDEIELYLYNSFILENIKKIIKKYNIKYDAKIKSSSSKKINKINLMRIDSNSNSIKDNTDLYEFVLLDIVTRLIKNKEKKNYRWCIHYYTLCKLIKYNINKTNKYCIQFIIYILDLYENSMEKMAIIAKGKEYIECNENLLKYSPNTLYSHQKDIFTILKKTDTISEPKLILYIAPTATGKTLTPISLSQQYKIIFVCAARHVGVALAKSAISLGKKVSFAFGCNELEDIRLHYFSASTYIKHERVSNDKSHSDYNICVCGKKFCSKLGQDIKYRNGAKKVNNSDGKLVEIMICDIKSYEFAMNYMCKFNKKEDMLLFWDEPTITLDYQEHECHSYIQQLWKQNIIPNIILSSATLPKQDEITTTIQSFLNKFENSKIYQVNSSECKKTIQISNTKGNVILPHLQYNDFNKLKLSVEYCLNNKTLYRYLDFDNICKFIVYINHDEDKYINEQLKINNYFKTIYSIDMENVKEYYLKLLNSFDENTWTYICDKYCKENVKGIIQNKYHENISNGMNITTCDAFTLTDGPTIYIAEDVDKIAKFCIQQSKIPQEVTSQINNNIIFNNKINDEINKIQQTVDAIEQKDIDAGNEKKLEREIKDPKHKECKKRINELNSLYKEITIDSIYIPNSLKHITKWYDNSVKNAFTSSVSNIDSHRIMQLSNIDDIWKVLLLIGIGLFSKNMPIEYTEIVKEFADNQKLYLIIANGDYIYGTNYQFCHSYIGKDLTNITQEKIIQSFGRVGRNKLQQTYSIRLRSDDFIDKILLPENDKIEVRNMNNLFQ